MTNKRLIDFLRNAKTGQFFPPTILYNEGWMLRLILDWFQNNPKIKHKLGVDYGAKWYSEALLPSAFLPRCRKDSRAERPTCADGIIGHFTIRETTRAGVKLTEAATQFVVVEAKIFSGLSQKVKNAPCFNQAARTVACMAEVAKRANIRTSQFENIAFYVVAPKSQIADNVFSEFMDRGHLQRTVKQRVDGYGDSEKQKWFTDCFLPTFQKIKTCVISWEEILDFISGRTFADGKALKEFYNKCLGYNKPALNRH